MFCSVSSTKHFKIKEHEKTITDLLGWAGHCDEEFKVKMTTALFNIEPVIVILKEDMLAWLVEKSISPCRSVHIWGNSRQAFHTSLTFLLSEWQSLTHKLKSIFHKAFDWQSPAGHSALCNVLSYDSFHLYRIKSTLNHCTTNPF